MPAARARARWLLVTLLALGPGCVIPTRQGLGVFSVTATLWESIEERSQDGWDSVPVGDGAAPVALRWVAVQGLAVEVGAEWSDGRVRVHAGAVRPGDELPALLPEDQGATDAAYDVLPAEGDVASVGTQVEVQGDSLAGALVPGERASLRGDLVVVGGREVVQLEERLRLEVSHSPAALALYGTGGALLTPLTAVVDVVLFVGGLPSLGYWALTDP
jgi:hypothetical protein